MVLYILPWWGRILFVLVGVGGVVGIFLKRERLGEGFSLRALLLLVAIAFSTMGVSILLFYFVISSFQTVPFWVVALATPVIFLNNLLPITIGGVGVREALSILVLHRFHISKEVALEAAFLNFFWSTFLPALLSVPLIWKKKSK